MCVCKKNNVVTWRSTYSTPCVVIESLDERWCYKSHPADIVLFIDFSINRLFYLTVYIDDESSYEAKFRGIPLFHLFSSLICLSKVVQVRKYNCAKKKLSVNSVSKPILINIIKVKFTKVSLEEGDTVSQIAGPTQDSVQHIMSTQECVTSIETCELTYKWTIEKFSVYGPYRKGIIESSTFSSHFSDFNDVWILRIDPNMQDYDDPDDEDYFDDEYIPSPIQWLSVQLELKSFNDTLPLFTICKISIHSNYSKNLEHEFKRPEATYWMQYITRKDLESSDEYLKNDDLQISCSMTIFRKPTNDSVVIPTFITTPLSADLKKILLNEQLADVTIKVGEKSFRVIKGILAARSPVFFAMFAHKQFKENKESEVIIEDIDEHVFEEFLHYIYTDEPKNVDKMPMELLQVADKYQVDRLKNICEEIICTTINSDNVTSILILSDKYNIEKLNKICLKFIKTNLRAVLSSESFQVYKKNNPEFFVSVLEAVVGIN